MNRFAVLVLAFVAVLTVFLDFTLASVLQNTDRSLRHADRSWPHVSPASAWSLGTRMPMTAANAVTVAKALKFDDSEEHEEEGRGKIKKKFKKFKKFLLPLLLAYKLKFFTLIPLLMGGLILLAKATGLAGFFFALFAATMGLKSSGH